MSSDTIDPGEGYRLLEPDELRRGGDWYRWKGEEHWHQLALTAEECTQNPRCYYRRRIEEESTDELVPFKLEPGKWYRQRGGGKVWVSGPSPTEGGPHTWVAIDCDYLALFFMDDGRIEPGCLNDPRDIIGPWIDEPTDEEIAEAVRWLHENDLLLIHHGDHYELEPAERGDKPPTGREFVDAVNKHCCKQGDG